MTDNEKAATFIGWKRVECQICEDYLKWQDEHPSPSTMAGGYYLNAAALQQFPNYSFTVHLPMHEVRALDMTDPRNYMKALEHWGDEDFGFNIWCCEGDIWTATMRVPVADVVPPCRGTSMANAIVALLAALYDAVTQA